MYLYHNVVEYIFESECLLLNNVGWFLISTCWKKKVFISFSSTPSTGFPITITGAIAIQTTTKMPSITITPTNSIYIVLCPFSINFTIILNSDNSFLISLSIIRICLCISSSWLTHFKNLSQRKHFMYSLPGFWLEWDTFLAPCIWHLGQTPSPSFSSLLLEEEEDPLISTVHQTLPQDGKCWPSKRRRAATTTQQRRHTLGTYDSSNNNTAEKKQQQQRREEAKKRRTKSTQRAGSKRGFLEVGRRGRRAQGGSFNSQAYDRCKHWNLGFQF